MTGPGRRLRELRIVLDRQGYRPLPDLLEMILGPPESRATVPENKLEALSLTGGPILGADMKRLLASTVFSGVRRFMFRSRMIGALELEALVEDRPVESLELEYHEFGEGIVALGAHAQALKTLKMSWCTIRGKDFKALLKNGAFPKLEVLSLGFNRLGKTGGVAMGKSTAFPALRELDLRDCGIGPDTVAAIASGPLAAVVSS